MIKFFQIQKLIITFSIFIFNDEKLHQNNDKHALITSHKHFFKQTNGCWNQEFLNENFRLGGRSYTNLTTISFFVLLFSGSQQPDQIRSWIFVRREYNMKTGQGIDGNTFWSFVMKWEKFFVLTWICEFL